ncbi:glycosyltransferase family 2 protein [Patescibacteria group bacterium]|nr:glycosyltransferase family 2 protein [Patescibacteria group bacterium]
MKSVSVIMATLNSEKTLGRCLKSVRGQNYDQSKIEILCADGGSTDQTHKIIKKYQGTVVPENSGSPEGAKSFALKKAKNEIILEVDDDNVLPNKNWLTRMVSYFDKEPKITGVYPRRYRHRRSDKPLNRYFSLFGVNDPVAYFLGRADRQSYYSSEWKLAGDAEDKGDYFLVRFNRDNLPTVGANGFLIKRELLLKAKVDPKHFFHIDVNMDLVKKGYCQYAVVKNDIFHISGERFWHFFKKRKKYMENLYLKDLSFRRYFLYQKDRDRKKIIAYSFYALTLIGPTIESIRGFVKIPDPAWFLHPIICFLIFWIYFFSTVNWQTWNYLGTVKKVLKKRRGLF